MTVSPTARHGVHGEVGIFRLSAASALNPHAGNNNQRLTAHLGLVVPAGTRLDVGEQSRPWEEGTVMVFDDALIHAATNDHPTEHRYILLMNMWKPGCCNRPGWRCYTPPS